ncbi:MAG: phosphoribosylamine--glycine ligase, partial [Candidatus Nanohaloarchaea archaeon]
CHTTAEAKEAIPEMATEDGVVIKARGLTGGKGVFVCDSAEEALDRIEPHAARFGEEVLISERLFGEEFSVFGMSDGSRFIPINMSFQDHKPLLEGGEGPNTGGMGAYGPAPVASQEVVQQVSEEVMTPVIQEMKDRGQEFRGFLYGGMMMTGDGPKVLEFNVRFGDPECQPAMMLMESDLYRMLRSCMDGDSLPMEFRPGASCCVVMASDGYPTDYETGFRLEGLAAAEEIPDVKVFHAGTRQEDGEVVTDGGRVVGVTAHSPDGIADARDRAYRGVSEIRSEGELHYRTDIADKALDRE